MIYVGYPCVGKSSISGIDKNIDLESSTFFYDVNGMGNYQRDSSWIEIYVNIIEDLNKQGFNVFVSSHGGVVAELTKRNLSFIGIFPNLSLEPFWIKRATERYEKNPSDKNKKALDRIKTHFAEDVNSLKESCKDNCIELYTCDYDLNEVITTLNHSNKDYKFQHCASCAWLTSGYCPIGTKIGCISVNGKVISNIEEFYKSSHNNQSNIPIQNA